MIYFDCHCDTLTEISAAKENLYKNDKNVDLFRVSSHFEKYAQIFALWIDRKKILPGKEEEGFEEIYRNALLLLEEQKECICLCTTYGEVEEAFRNNKNAALLAVEDLSIAGSYLDHLRDLKIRFATLTWNYENEYGFGAAVNPQGHLKKRGRETVKKLVEQGIVLDVSHLSQAGFYDVCEETNQPFLASHSNSHAVCPHARNLTDEQFTELIKRKGLCGINLYRPFLSEDGDQLYLLRHIDHVLSLGGEEILCFGCDFDGGHNDFIQGIKGVESMEPLIELLLSHHYSEDLVKRLFYQNGFEFLNRVLD